MKPICNPPSFLRKPIYLKVAAALCASSMSPASARIYWDGTSTVTIGNGGGNRDLTVGAGGMTLVSGGGTVTIGNAGSGSNVIVRLGTSQTWTNHSTASLTNRNSTTGLATGNAPATLTLSATNTGMAGFYKIVDWAGSTGFIAGDFVATNLAGGTTGTFTMDSGTSALYLTVVPEPDAAMLVGSLGLLDLLRRPRTQ